MLTLVYNASVRPSIILFAKAPVPGRVKTRLRGLSPAAAARLHAAFVRDAFELLGSLEPRADLELHTDVPTDEWSDLEVSRFLQAGGDLGARLLAALTAGLAAGRPQVIIVGADAPTLPRSHVERLLDLGADVALGPAEDGGFYAIACRRTDPRMFAGVRWSSRRTLDETVRAATACGLRVELGDPWFDVDTMEDLRRLAASPALPRHTAAWLARYGRLFGARGSQRNLSPELLAAAGADPDFPDIESSLTCRRRAAYRRNDAPRHEGDLE
jgi:rSAM/selenodomain-associated transferase 1